MYCHCNKRRQGRNYPSVRSPLPPYALITSVLFEVVLAFESSAAHLTAESQLGALVGPLVDHQVVGLGELPLAIFADEFVLGAHFSTELAPTNVVVNLYYRKHRV
jgi:hypothetical protein